MSNFFAAGVPVLSARAPGRLDVMGGIADYSGALVLQLPLDRATTARLQRQNEPWCDIVSVRDGHRSTFNIGIDEVTRGDLHDPSALREWFASHPSDAWAAYVVGVVQWCLARSTRPNPDRPGLRLWLESTVPEGKGVSSSAAIEVATMMVVAASEGIELTPPEVATACQWVENHVVGAPCGIMDQMTSACGRQDRLLRLRCQPFIIEGHAPIPRGFRFYGIDSGVRHAVTGADYGTVRTAAFMGYRIIADMAGLENRHYGHHVSVTDSHWHGYLANIPVRELEARFVDHLPERMLGRDFLARYHGTTDTVTRVQADREYPVRQATVHPIYEQSRVDQFLELLGALHARGDVAPDLGALMRGSHDSYSACGLGSEATDRVVAMVEDVGPERGLFGAKITGGGSGGTVAILGRADAEPVVRELAGRYARETGRVADVFARSGPGAAESGVKSEDS